ncbi:MAG: hypothetical protein KGJ86_01030 [Chloroflexota bacterium]|nr:hypothetical protein [Chloroflexota bacterium]
MFDTVKHRLRQLLVVISASASLLVALPAGPAMAAAPADYPVTDGWFYSQAGGGAPNQGFNILDRGLDAQGQVIRFYSEFNRLGGLTLGYPASGFFLLPDGFTYQATQAALLQWHPEEDGVELANVFDLLSQTGHDKDLLALGIPPPIADDGSGGNFSKAVQIRFGWLTNPLIKARFLANPNPGAIKQWDAASSIQLYGLPTSQPYRSGPFLVQRFQRVAFQLWLDAIPGQPSPGTVVPILGGDYAKRFGLVPAAAQTPQPPASAPLSQPAFAVQTMASLQPAIALLQQYDQAHRTSYMKNLGDHHVSVIVAAITDPRALGFYSPDDNIIRISNKAVNEDAHDVADLISHESSHAFDFWTGVDINSVQGCFNTELTAFKHQADVWLWFYPKLKPPPQDQLDQFLNDVTSAVQSDPSGFLQELEQEYHHQCAT